MHAALTMVKAPRKGRKVLCRLHKQHKWLRRGAVDAEELEQWGAPADLLASKVVREVVCVDHLYTPRLAEK
jgi:hypothetical protein